jgi:hypothetical protein
MRISTAQRIENENRIRTAMDRLQRGEIPPGGKCDVKTLAREAGNRPHRFLWRPHDTPPLLATGPLTSTTVPAAPSTATTYRSDAARSQARPASIEQ